MANKLIQLKDGADNVFPISIPKYNGDLNDIDFTSIFEYTVLASNAPTSENTGFVFTNYGASAYKYQWAFVGNQSGDIYKRIAWSTSEYGAWQKVI